MMYKVEYIQRYNGDWARWGAKREPEHGNYKTKLNEVFLLGDLGGINIRRENHFEKEGVQYIVEIIVPSYEDDDYGPVLTITLERVDKEFILEFLIIRSYGEIIDEKILKFEANGVLPVDDLGLVFKEIEEIVLMSLDKWYLK